MLEDWKQYHTRPYELKALAWLEDSSGFPGMLELPAHRMLVQLFTLHSFQPYCSWSVFPGGKESHVIRRVRWDLSRDFVTRDLIMDGDDPTIYGADVLVPANEIDQRLEGLAQIRFPAFAMRSTIGIDGVTFGVKRCCFGQHVELRWWCDPPNGWEKLGEWHHEFVDYVEAHLPAHTDRFGRDAIRP